MSEHSEEQPATVSGGGDSGGDETTAPDESPAPGPGSDTGDDRHEPVDTNGPVADRLDTDDLEPY